MSSCKICSWNRNTCSFTLLFHNSFILHWLDTFYSLLFNSPVCLEQIVSFILQCPIDSKLLVTIQYLGIHGHNPPPQPYGWNWKNWTWVQKVSQFAWKLILKFFRFADYGMWNVNFPKQNVDSVCKKFFVNCFKLITHNKQIHYNGNHKPNLLHIPLN